MVDECVHGVEDSEAREGRHNERPTGPSRRRVTREGAATGEAARPGAVHRARAGGGQKLRGKVGEGVDVGQVVHREDGERYGQDRQGGNGELEAHCGGVVGRQSCWTPAQLKCRTAKMGAGEGHRVPQSDGS